MTPGTVIQTHDGALWRQMGKCGGECCRLISLPAFPPEDIALRAARNRLRERGQEVRVWTPDADFVVANFVYVRSGWVDPINGRDYKVSSQLAVLKKGGTAKPRPEYRCQKWTGTKCGDYENRPGLCRSFGMPGQSCERADCSYRWRYVGDRPALDAWENEGGRVGPAWNPKEAE